VKSSEDFDDSSDVSQLFRRAAGSDMEIDWTELQKVLNSSFQRGKYSFLFILFD
jgi:calpain